MYQPDTFLYELQMSELPGQAKQVIIQLRLNDQKTGGCSRLSVVQFMHATGLSEKQVVKAMYQAFKAKWLACGFYIHGEIPADTTAYTILESKQYRAPKQKIIRITKSPKLMSLPEWEQQNGMLSIIPMMGWVRDKKLNANQVRELINEFRIEMTGKGKPYANFVAAFQTYLTKGWLSKKIEQIVEKSPADKYGTQTSTRGANL